MSSGGHHRYWPGFTSQCQQMPCLEKIEQLCACALAPQIPPDRCGQGRCKSLPNALASMTGPSCATASMADLGMEVYASYPASMPLARHDSLAGGQVPHVPLVVVTGRHCDWLCGMHSHACHRLRMRCHCAQQPPGLDRRWLRLRQSHWLQPSLVAASPKRHQLLAACPCDRPSGGAGQMQAR